MPTGSDKKRRERTRAMEWEELPACTSRLEQRKGSYGCLAPGQQDNDAREVEGRVSVDSRARDRTATGFRADLEELTTGYVDTAWGVPFCYYFHTKLV